MTAMQLITPKHIPPLDPNFRPAVLANQKFQADVQATGQAEPLVIALKRNGGRVSRCETTVFNQQHPRASENLA